MSVPTNAITRDRLAEWAIKLNEQHATPVLLIGVGHDYASGELVMCTMEQIHDADVILMVKGALKALEARLGR